MAKLRALLDTLDGVPEALRDLYTVGEDGKFRLDAEGVEDVSGLKSALERTKRELRDAKGKLPEGFDPAKWDELLALQEEFAKGRLTEKQREEFDSLKRQLQDQHTKELTKRDQRITALADALRRELITSRATSAIAAAKGSVRLLLPHVERQSKVVEQEDGSFVPVIVDEEGHTRIGDGGRNMSYEEFVAELRTNKEFLGAFEGTGSSGGGAPRSAAGGGAGKTVIPAGDNQAFIANLDKIAKGEVEVRAG